MSGSFPGGAAARRPAHLRLWFPPAADVRCQGHSCASDIRQLTDVSACNLQQYLSCKGIIDAS
jgi:hypothetical protein